MKFLLFNIVVVAALGYLAFADTEDIEAATARAGNAVMSVREMAQAAMAKVVDRDPDLEPAIVEEPPAEAPDREPAGETDVAALAPLEEEWVETPEIKPIPGQGGGEVVVEESHRPAPKVALADGEMLMSPKERRRELDSLAREMEMLSVDKAGM